MILSPVNLENKLKKAQARQMDEASILEAVEQILRADTLKEEAIRHHLEDGLIKENDFEFEKLNTQRIYHIDTIKAICIDYRLRFLDSTYFKPKFPYEAICEIKSLEKEHETTLGSFKIMAPSKLMKLENADDPVLFAPIGNGYFYLIHKWGSDLHPLRKWLYYPFRNINITAASALLFSLLLTLLVPRSIYDEAHAQTQFWFMFLFIFKAVGFILIFYGVSLGKNFNNQIWNSRYYNG